MSSINFFSEDINFTLPRKKSIKNWIQNVVKAEDFFLSDLNIVFSSDAYLLSINQQYLSHDYYTDIITFDNSDASGIVEGDIFISIDRVKDNALIHNKPFLIELHRVLIHGILHLMGYDDHSPHDILIMRQKEDCYLSLLQPDNL